MNPENFSKEYLGSVVRKDIAEQIKNARNSGERDKAKEIAGQHHERARQLAETVERNRKGRSVAELIKNGYIFAHGMPILENDKLKSAVTGNNKVLRGQNLNAFERLKLVIDKSPTLSTSTLSAKRHRLGAAYPTGVLLADGFVQQGYSSDEGTMAVDEKTRVSKYKTAQEQTKVQDTVDFENIEKKSDELGEKIIKSNGQGYAYHYNEYVVSKPPISSLFIDLDYYDPEKQANNETVREEDRDYVKKSTEQERRKVLLTLNQLSRATGLPIVGLKNQNGLLEKTILEINDAGFLSLVEQERKLQSEADHLFERNKGKSNAQIDDLDKKIINIGFRKQAALKKLTISERQLEGLPAGRGEAEKIIQEQLIRNINNTEAAA
jgi:hypothetical protein